MTEQITIDSLEFARKSLENHGTIPLFAFPRLKDELHSPEGVLDYSLAGVRGPRGEPELVLHVHGKLRLVCQRCLGPMEYALDATARFVVVPGEGDLPDPEDEREDADYLVADARLDLVALIEDEVLLSLPLAPAHADASCNDAMPSLQGQKESPFKVLQGLKLNKD